jgi:hypothetical protein
MGCDKNTFPMRTDLAALSVRLFLCGSFCVRTSHKHPDKAIFFSTIAPNVTLYRLRSTIYQLPSIGYHRSAVGDHLSAEHLPAAVCRPRSIGCHLSAEHLPATGCRLSATIYWLPSIGDYRLAN